MATTSKPLILIVEDEKKLADLISERLEMEGMLTQIFTRAASVLPFFRQHFANLILLDVNLPDRSGLALMDELKRLERPVPVIFLTADSSELAKVKALEVGGDDYITKPFSFPELVARIRAVLRRSETAYDQHITKNTRLSEEAFDFCGARVFPTRLEVTFPNGNSMKLGRKELGIIATLVNNAGKVMTRRSLIHAVWGIHADVRSRSLDQYIVKIRTAFRDAGCPSTAFRTIHGVGYIYEPNPIQRAG